MGPWLWIHSVVVVVLSGLLHVMRKYPLCWQIVVIWNPMLLKVFFFVAISIKPRNFFLCRKLWQKLWVAVMRTSSSSWPNFFSEQTISLAKNIYRIGDFGNSFIQCIFPRLAFKDWKVCTNHYNDFAGIVYSPGINLSDWLVKDRLLENQTWSRNFSLILNWQLVCMKQTNKWRLEIKFKLDIFQVFLHGERKSVANLTKSNWANLQKDWSML